ncbi:MAG: hypothetical protein HPY53_01285 [Brevinematales bacterium]|nr:hypothetical protein [Brevinematales bacterium]
MRVKYIFPIVVIELFLGNILYGADSNPKGFYFSSTPKGFFFGGKSEKKSEQNTKQPEEIKPVVQDKPSMGSGGTSKEYFQDLKSKISDSYTVFLENPNKETGKICAKNIVDYIKEYNKLNTILKKAAVEVVAEDEYYKTYSNTDKIDFFMKNCIVGYFLDLDNMAPETKEKTWAFIRNLMYNKFRVFAVVKFASQVEAIPEDIKNGLGSIFMDNEDDVYAKFGIKTDNAVMFYELKSKSYVTLDKMIFNSADLFSEIIKFVNMYRNNDLSQEK